MNRDRRTSERKRRAGGRRASPTLPRVRIGGVVPPTACAGGVSWRRPISAWRVAAGGDHAHAKAPYARERSRKFVEPKGGDRPLSRSRVQVCAAGRGLKSGTVASERRRTLQLLG